MLRTSIEASEATRSQAIVASYVFEGFGGVVAQTGSATNTYKFAATSAYRDDGDAGLLHVGLRYYEPSVGRFITADPLLGDIFRPQSLNRYVYVENNPVNLVDPSGMTWADVGAFVIIAALAFAAALTATTLGAAALIAGFVVVVGAGLWFGYTLFS